MKLNKLKKLIKETLLAEQPSPTGNGRRIRMLPCPGNTNATTQITWDAMSINGNVPVVGDKVDLTNVPYLSNHGYWKVVEVNPSQANCTHPANVNGVCDLPTHNNPCDDGPREKCTERDFAYNATPCGQTHLVPAPGGAGSWNTWLTNQWNAYSTGVTATGNPVGCFQFGAIITWITDQLNNGGPWNQIQTDRKEAKRDWAVCMADHCDCDINTGWDDPRDPCKKLMADPMHSACCIKCQNPNLPASDPCAVHCKCCDPDPEPCVNGTVTPASPDWGKCLECFGMQPTPSPWPSITGAACECCKRDGTGDDVRGCMDPSAINYMQCCPGNPAGCVPTVQFDDCCEYDRGDKCPNGIITQAHPDWGYCQECFFNPPGPNPTITGIKCECCKERRDPALEIECHKCDNGYPISNMFAGNSCPAPWQTMPPFNPQSCGPNPDDPVDMVDPGLDRMKELMEYKKPK